MTTVTGTPLATNIAFNSDISWLLAKRACPGANQAIANNIKTIGVNAWLDIQINHQNINDTIYESEMKRMFPFYNNMAYKDFLVHYSYLGSGSQPQQYLITEAYMHEQWRSKKQLRMGMVDHWLDHFNINLSSVGRDIMPHFNAIRNNATGSFTEMIKGIYSTRPMHEYLTNNFNTKNGPNQNLARELLELHTIGVNNGYTQDDVIAVSRLLSGVTVDGMGNMYFTPANHDMNPVKTTFGWSSSNNATTADGIKAQMLDLLTYLSKMPATAHHIAQKLITHFVSDTPQPNLETRMVNAYLSQNTDMGLMIKILFSSVEFQNSLGQKFRRPQQQLTSVLSMGNVTMDLTSFANKPYPDSSIMSLLLNRLRNSVHAPLEWLTPDGYPQSTAYWATMGSVDSSWILTGETVYDVYGKASNTGVTYYNKVDWAKIFGVVVGNSYKSEIVKTVQAMTGHTPNNATILALYRIWKYSDTVTNINEAVTATNRFVFVVQAITASPYFLIN